MSFGDVIRSAASPSIVPLGIGGDDNTIWHSDYTNTLVRELSTADFSVVRSAASPSTHPRGMGGTVNTIWHSDADADRNYELSTTDFSVVMSAATPSTFPRGIGGDDNTVWHSDQDAELIYELSTADFSVVRSASSPHSAPDRPAEIGGTTNTIWHTGQYVSPYVGVIYELSTVDFSVKRSANTLHTWPLGVGGTTNTIWQSDSASDLIYELDVAIVAPAVTTDPPSLVQPAQATLNGTLDDDGFEVCDCGFEWGETIAYGNTTPTQSRTTGQTFSQPIVDLIPGATYHFRALATNSGGTGYGADRTFTTFSEQDSVDQTIIGNKVSLEALRNLEIVYGGRFYISKSGNFVYESRYHRNV